MLIFSNAIFIGRLEHTTEIETEGEKTLSSRCLIIPESTPWTWRVIRRRQSHFVNRNDHVSLSQSIDLNTNDEGHGTVTMWVYLRNPGNTWLWFSSVRWCQCLTMMGDLIIRRWREQGVRWVCRACPSISVNTWSASGPASTSQTSSNCLKQLVVASLSRHQSSDCDQHRHVDTFRCYSHTEIDLNWRALLPSDVCVDSSPRHLRATKSNSRC